MNRWMLTAAAALVFFCAPSRQAPAVEPDKFHDLGHNEDEVVERAREVNEVILAVVEDVKVKGEDWNFSVTVVQSYKGSLKPGDKIHVSTSLEQGPKRETLIGKKWFFFLADPNKDAPDDDGSYGFDWVNFAPYDMPAGAELDKLLRTIPQHELAWVNELLTPSDRKEAAPSEDAQGDKDSGQSRTLLSMHWVSRAELLARKSFWEKCVAAGTLPPAKMTYGEKYEEFTFGDNAVCSYAQGVPQYRLLNESQTELAGSQELDGDKTEPIFPKHPQRVMPDDYSSPFLSPVWTRWEPDEKARQLYRGLADFPKSAEANPTDTSWCVLMQYFDSGKSWVVHFYVPSRIEIQQLLYDVHEIGYDCTNWDDDDKHFTTIPAWMKEDLKYSRTIDAGKQ